MDKIQETGNAAEVATAHTAQARPEGSAKARASAYKTQQKARQAEVIGLLICGQTLENIATQTGIGRRTLAHWHNHDAEFVAALERAKADMMMAREEIRKMARGEAGISHKARYKLCLILAGITEEDVRKGEFVASKPSGAVRKMLGETKAMIGREWIGRAAGPARPIASQAGLIRLKTYPL